MHSPSPQHLDRSFPIPENTSEDPIADRDLSSTDFEAPERKSNLWQHLRHHLLPAAAIGSVLFVSACGGDTPRPNGNGNGNGNGNVNGIRIENGEVVDDNPNGHAIRPSWEDDGTRPVTVPVDASKPVEEQLVALLTNYFEAWVWYHEDMNRVADMSYVAPWADSRLELESRMNWEMDWLNGQKLVHTSTPHEIVSSGIGDFINGARGVSICVAENYQLLDAAGNNLIPPGQIAEFNGTAVLQDNGEWLLQVVERHAPADAAYC